ncbi:glycosyltransferase family 4 protein [Halomarina halobia]|uniref:Glycosyltransferase family 4 protein n=1 Tax=Halomarina halobia TaxID=3033386 RepID=A0ABD6ADL6_9EURY|nr:glycosyltransferase family 4 protein [Halomarina sp. PSR21]
MGLHYQMRVLNSLPDPRVGGPQLRSFQVAKGLRVEGIETVFLLPEGDDTFAEMATAEGFTVRRPGIRTMRPPRQVLANVQYVLDLPRAVLKIRTLLDEEEVDLVQANMPTDIPTGLAAGFSDLPLLWNFEDVSTPWPVGRTAAVLAARIADEVTVVADAVADHYFPGDEVEARVIHAPVDLDKFDPDRVTASRETLAAEIGADLRRPIIGTIGNINPVKGHEYLLRATRRLTDQFGPVTVLIVGGAPETRAEYVRDLKALRAELGLEESVHFLGRRSDVPELLSLFDVFALPSVAEACPMVVLEAMAMERPIVATRVGGVPEQLDDGVHGRLVPPADPDALTAAIGEALSDPAVARRWGERARERAKEEFSLDRCVERHVAAYRAAAGHECG